MLSRSITALALLATTAGALAQAPAVPAEFSAGAQPLTAEALQQRLSGKEFQVPLADGSWWRLQFQYWKKYLLFGWYQDRL